MTDFPRRLPRELPERVYCAPWQRSVWDIFVAIVLTSIPCWYILLHKAEGAFYIQMYLFLGAGFYCLYHFTFNLAEPLLAAFYSDKIYIRRIGVIPRNKIKDIRFEAAKSKYLRRLIAVDCKIQLAVESESERKLARKMKNGDGSVYEKEIRIPIYVEITDESAIKQLIFRNRNYRS